ncbi:hypothetical protein HYFRA_00013871 [Hymenoscyphus fraxineus]|uniref:Uncharacterized protein n=1 Tax=Hymenoscyphus fraxineus TaxID=746836 RepID=A0A9N9PZK3_9HELO|nr:hypothetical protein HYFRA_00013871 [Hymenoscyphus fraxineus]
MVSESSNSLRLKSTCQLASTSAFKRAPRTSPHLPHLTTTQGSHLTPSTHGSAAAITRKRRKKGSVKIGTVPEPAVLSRRVTVSDSQRVVDAAPYVGVTFSLSRLSLGSRSPAHGDFLGFKVSSAELAGYKSGWMANTTRVHDGFVVVGF